MYVLYNPKLKKKKHHKETLHYEGAIAVVKGVIKVRKKVSAKVLESRGYDLIIEGVEKAGTPETKPAPPIPQEKPKKIEKHLTSYRICYIIYVCNDRKETLWDLIVEVMNIGRLTDIQLIVVDDASTEDIFDIVKYVPRTWIRFPQHLGYVAAMKKAIGFVDAESVVLLRNGGIFNPELIGELLKLNKGVML